MKPKFFTTSVLTAAAIAIGSTATLQQPSKAAGGTIFECAVYLNGPDKGTPVTIAYAPGATEARAIINWKSKAFNDSGYDPMTRCKEVSARFQTYYNNGTLNFITTGVENNQPVICVSSQNGGACSGLLFTLLPGADASKVIQRLFDIRDLGAGPLNQSNPRIYVPMNDILNKAPTIGADEVNLRGTGNSSTPQAAPSSKPGSSGGW